MARKRSRLQRVAALMDGMAADILVVRTSARRLCKAAAEAVKPLLPWLAFLYVTAAHWWRELSRFLPQ